MADNFKIEIEQLLENAGEHGLSMKQMKNLTSLNKKKIKRIIYNSTKIKDTNPYLHGSSKNKINVYSFKFNNQVPSTTYIESKKIMYQRNLKKPVNLIEEGTNEPVHIPTQPQPQCSDDYIFV